MPANMRSASARGTTEDARAARPGTAFRGKERRPLVQLHQIDARTVAGRRSSICRCSLRERRGFPDQPVFERIMSRDASLRRQLRQRRPSHSGILNPSIRATVGATSGVPIGAPCPRLSARPRRARQARRGGTTRRRCDDWRTRCPTDRRPAPARAPPAASSCRGRPAATARAATAHSPGDRFAG